MVQVWVRNARRQCGRVGFLAACGIVAFNAAFVLFLAIHPGTPSFIRTVDNLAQIAGPLVTAPMCFGGLRRLRRFRGERANGRRAPGQLGADLLGLGVLAYVAGSAIWAYYVVVLNQDVPYPSIADIAYLAVYPLSLAGIAFLPHESSSGARRTRVVLDGLMIMTACATFSWYFILGPTVLAGNESTLARVVGTAYPLGDLALIACLLAIPLADSDSGSIWGVRAISLGLVVEIVSDWVFNVQTLNHTYQPVSMWDVGWPLSEMLICLGVWSVLRAHRRQATVPSEHGAALQREDRTWRPLLPYLLLPAVLALLLATEYIHGAPILRSGLYIGAAVLVCLIVVRQVAALAENRRLYRDLGTAYTELHVQNQRLESLATTDALTELPNHRAMHQVVTREIERSRRYGRPCAVLFLDLDHFKALNDAFGHAAGDAALRELALLLRRTVRQVDLVGRWGGEEFVALLPETNPADACIVAEKVRSAVAGHHFGVGGGSHLTCSVGAASYPDDGRDREALLQAADRAMYAAKMLGRNQVRTPSDPAIAALLSTSSSSRDDAAMEGTVEALASLVEARDAYTAEHNLDVGRLAMRIAMAMGLGASEARMVGLVGRLHDIGKVAVPDAVLLKAGSLTPIEWTIIHRHPAMGAEVVTRVPSLRPLAEAIRAHHERWDGSGYPMGLAADQIPLAARIIAVADAFGAMVTRRPYREPMQPYQAIEELRRCAGTQFDPSVVEALERVMVDEVSFAESA